MASRASSAPAGQGPTRPAGLCRCRSGTALPAHGLTGPQRGRLCASWQNSSVRTLIRTSKYSLSSDEDNTGAVLTQTVTSNERVVGGPGSSRHTGPASNCHIQASPSQHGRGMERLRDDGGSGLCGHQPLERARTAGSVEGDPRFQSGGLVIARQLPRLFCPPYASGRHQPWWAASACCRDGPIRS
ncbi:MAG: hypothetical protein JWN19_871 [Arthrobacter sp.]|nr:hypothetical protein [Arthrobacter sp.]